jgi:hypothetical protein
LINIIAITDIFAIIIDIITPLLMLISLRHYAITPLIRCHYYAIIIDYATPLLMTLMPLRHAIIDAAIL